MQKPYHITGGQLDAFIQCVVNTLVTLAFEYGDLVDVLVNDIDGFVSTRAIDDDMFAVCIVLSRYGS